MGDRKVKEVKLCAKIYNWLNKLSDDIDAYLSPRVGLGGKIKSWKEIRKSKETKK